ncbi:Uncharacterised protein [Mycobacteroides abscessus subsp. abscessus]|uniref:hypothetical protein n=1 Tax=Mycobacteroides abscessus TaxID=36809 RepID=UPI00092BAEFD|nr:hypothetical protein [Mycobacteroides abscessus]MDB2220711.1 hypothetical protein [Mycobacteroides abscessus subsp. abscessus]SID00153.1 Uncharacterised protein [Mycobacteroides abscessus subsp. abscessus]
MPDTPGVEPVLAGAEDPGAVGAVLAAGSWEAVAELTAVVMDSAAMGMSVSGMLGMRGRDGLLASWWVTLGWWACCWPAGVPDEAGLGDLTLGAVGVPDGALPEMRLERVGFEMRGLVGAAGVLVVLCDSALDGVLARGISGSCCGVTSGVWPWL